MHNAHACKQHVQLWLVTLTLIFIFFQYFEGNNDKNSEVKHVIYRVFQTRFLQFLPKAHQGGVCMRTEVFGVKSKPGNVKHLLFFN